MSKSDRPNRFDDWVTAEFRETGGFTALVILVSIGDLNVTPLRSTFFHVIGDELDWDGVAQLLSGAGSDWNGVLFASVSEEGEGGPVPDPIARRDLDKLARQVKENRLVLNENHFFDRHGRRLQVEEAPLQ